MGSTSVTFDIGPDTQFLPTSDHHDDELQNPRSTSRMNEQQPFSVSTSRMPLDSAKQAPGYRDDHLPRNGTTRNGTTHAHNGTMRNGTSRNGTTRTDRHYAEVDKPHRDVLKKMRGACTMTTAAITTCYIITLLTLGLAVYNLSLYSRVHGFGPGAVGSNAVVGGHGSVASSQLLGHENNNDEHDSSIVTDQTSLNYNYPDANSGSSFAHIVGNGERVGTNDQQMDRLIIWRKNATRNVDFRSGSGVIRILEPGFYYVYSQVYFIDSTDSAIDLDPVSGAEMPMVFSTKRNNSPIMESVLTFTQYTTKYHGGTFHLERGDEIGVSVSNGRLRISSNGERTYFGVFMIAGTGK